MCTFIYLREHRERIQPDHQMLPHTKQKITNYSKLQRKIYKLDREEGKKPQKKSKRNSAILIEILTPIRKTYPIHLVRSDSD